MHKTGTTEKTALRLDINYKGLMYHTVKLVYTIHEAYTDIVASDG